jgi:O-antigen ligase
MAFAEGIPQSVCVFSAGWHERIIAGISCMLLFLSMAFPSVPALVSLKTVLFAILLAAVVLGCLAGRFRLDHRLMRWTLALTAMGLLFVLKGLWAGNVGASAVVTVFIFWPIAFTLWIAGVTRERAFVLLERTIFVATLLIGLYGALYLLTELGMVPDIGVVSALSLGFENQSFGATEGYTRMAIAGINSLPFLLPCVMASCAIESSGENRSRFWRAVGSAACAVSWLIMLACGRRALFLIVFFTPLLILLFQSFRPEAEKREGKNSLVRFSAVFAAAVVILFAGLTMVYDFDVHLLWDRFAVGFDLSSQTPDDDAAPRNQQFHALTRGWLDQPIFGAGLGASVLGSIRSETMPWSYELSYVALLYQTGIVGFLAYTAAVAWIFRRGIQVIGKGGHLAQIMIPLLVGLSGLLIANGTNPYLGCFDEMWTLFLPLAVINYRLSTCTIERGQFLEV